MTADLAPSDLLLRVAPVGAALSIVFGLAVVFGARMRVKRLVGLVTAQIGVGVLAAMSGGASGLGRSADPASPPTTGLMTMTLLAVAVVTLLVGAVLISHASRGSGADSAS